ncbi:hypothetical protein E2C01_100950 [Portunus trituberculatus]|uniref:Uncharacterized protein n=1 Tax=Portunus trituberculatus TaxID=210409 RepID=A0A5B7KJ82_PORTR|nr:hypothetical protein [Portunus trituberculatus]
MPPHSTSISTAPQNIAAASTKHHKLPTVAPLPEHKLQSTTTPHSKSQPTTSNFHHAIATPAHHSHPSSTAHPSTPQDGASLFFRLFFLRPFASIPAQVWSPSPPSATDSEPLLFGSPRPEPPAGASLEVSGGHGKEESLHCASSAKADVS